MPPTPSPIELTTLIDACGTTTSALAKKTGLSFTAIRSWEHNKGRPNESSVFKLADALEVPIPLITATVWPDHPMNLKLRRINAGHTRPSLANTLNISETSVRYWETGRSIPNPPLFPTVAQTLNISPWELMRAINHHRPCGNPDNPNLDDVLLAYGWTKQALAEHLGLPYHTVTRIGHQPMYYPEDIAKKISTIIGIPTHIIKQAITNQKPAR